MPSLKVFKFLANYLIKLYLVTGKKMKIIQLLIKMLLGLGLIYYFLPTESKLIVFSNIERPWFRLHPHKPSVFINKGILNNKLEKGLPNWALTQIEEDLSHFDSISAQDLDTAYQKINTEFNRLVRFKINQGKISNQMKDKTILNLRSYKAILNVLEFLAANNYISDTDFIISFQDYIKFPELKSYPIFTFSKDMKVEHEKDSILIPDWMNLQTWAETRLRIRYANYLYPWQTKTDKLFWRGGWADSSGFRKKLVELGTRYPQFIDAIFSQGNPKEFVRPELHLKYKYQISIDGARATWEGLIWQLHGNSLVFKNNSRQMQWFHKGIQPHLHYIGVDDESDLLKELDWARNHEPEVKQIIDNAQTFANNNLELEDMYHYIIILLKTYNQKLKQE
ncbi:MAG: protein O-glucosyltransferase 2-like [Francisellaceae bacterium]|nr:protein O-glucosyltransferase 2-like [Francisellaceae bacterium]